MPRIGPNMQLIPSEAEQAADRERDARAAAERQRQRDEKADEQRRIDAVAARHRALDRTPIAGLPPNRP